MDHCRNPETGEIEGWARDIISRLNSYTEISPSGCGVHILVNGKLPPGDRRRKGKIEMYSEGRYFTMTGHHLEDTPSTIEDRQTELADLHQEIFGQKKAIPKPPGPSTDIDPSDQGLIDKAHQAANGQKFARLWQGDTTGYETASEATAALIKMLVFWCGPDQERIDRLFRQSGLIREKWDRRQSGSTWGRLEIEKAIAGTTEFYTPGRRPPDPAHQKTPPEPTPQAAKFHLTDLGNAQRLVTQHGQDLRYCYPWGKWLIWDGTRWVKDESGEADRRAKATVRSIYAEATDIEEKTMRKALADHARKSEADGKRQAMLSSARSESGIAVMPEDFDRDPWLFNVLNGTIDLRTGELRPHRREDLITKLAPVNYDPDAEYQLWWKFLERIMAGDLETMFFLQKAAGYALTGSTREQCLFFLYGLGANGKTTLLEVLKALLDDYGHQTTSETFMAKRHGGQIPNDVAALRGARLVVAQEVEAGRRLAEVLVKELTGGDRVTARFLHQEFFSFKPEFKLWLAANHKPIVRGTDQAIWRRIRLIPFTVQIPEAEQDKDLVDKLKDELPGILNWATEGCLAWQEEGLNPPQAVQDATQNYRDEMDTLADFLAECCLVAPGASALASELYQTYTKWAEDNGEKKPFSQKVFGLILAERGFERGRGHGGKTVWKGISVKD